jgi:putative tricarboxylic transport membrane protein
VLGPLFELNVRHSLLMSDGSFAIFFTRPISAGCMGIALLMLASAIIPAIGKAKGKISRDVM